MEQLGVGHPISSTEEMDKKESEQLESQSRVDRHEVIV